MPRKARIDAPGALHHIICRGIERRWIFREDADRDNFVERLGFLIKESKTICYAWALLQNHFHLLLRTGTVPISILMRRLLTGYSVSFNRKYRRSGHLFQNRYKSILCQEDPYLKELIRYIHLNPFRAKIVRTLEDLDRYAYSGHSNIMGKMINDWQERGKILGMFAAGESEARMKYREFLKNGIRLGRRPEFTGGGLIRSTGGWQVLKSEKRMRAHLKGDERILGDSDFVNSVLKKAAESMERKYKLKTEGVDFEKIVKTVTEIFNIDERNLLSPGKERIRSQARSLLCYMAVKELGESATKIAERIGMSQSAVSKAVRRGEMIAGHYGWLIFNTEKS